MATKLSYNISEGWSGEQGGANIVILDPAERKVWSWHTIGNAIPVSVFNSRELVLFSYSGNIEPESVEKWLRENEAAIVDIADCYQGDYWDGNNLKGRWSEKSGALEQEFYYLANQAMEDGEIHSYLEAADWIAGSHTSDMLTEELLEEYKVRSTHKGTPFQRCVDAWMSHATTEGVLLRESEVEETIREAVEGEIERLLGNWTLFDIEEIIEDPEYLGEYNRDLYKARCIRRAIGG